MRKEKLLSVCAVLAGMAFAAVAASPAKPVVDANLPAGCLKKATVDGDKVHLVRDYRDSPQGWFYWAFRVTGAAGRTLTFDFPGAKWSVGSRGAAVSVDKGRSWRWSSESEHKPTDAFTWTFAKDADEVWFSQTIPYLPKDWEAFLKAHARDRGCVFETGELCKSKKGRSVPFARFGRLDGQAKVRFFLSSRHHCQEATATFVVEGMAASFFGDDDLCAWLRENVELRVVPFADYDGVVDGDQGKNRLPHDHCRDYNENRPQVHPEVAAIMKMLKAWKPTIVQDTHCPWLRSGDDPHDTNGFAYQVGNAGNKAAMAKFGKILERVQRSGFDYRAEDDVPYGRYWNAGANYTQGQTLNIWAQFDLRTCQFVTTFEIPFANQHEKTLRENDFLGFGRDIMLAYRELLSSQHGEVLYNGIRLPKTWPPRTEAFLNKHEPPKPFYLEEKNIPDTIPVDLGRQLFVDDFLIAEMKGLKREYPHPVKYAGNPVLKPETWLEKNGTHNRTARPNGGGMWWDPHLKCYRLWYEAGWLNAIAYATSSNGVDFVRPDIADGTNQVYPTDLRPDSWEVVPDYAADDPYSRWCLFLSGPGGDEPSALLTSKNGQWFSGRVLTGRCGDRSNFFYNPFRDKWVYSIRAWTSKGEAYRCASYFETDDFPGKCTWEWNPKTPGESKDLVAWARADEKDGVDPEFKCPAQLYALQAVAYESILLGAFEIHRGPDNLAASEMGNPKITDIVFAYSRDGFHWTRPDRTPAIASERWGSGKWDTGYVQPLGNLCTIFDEQLRFYYGAFAGDTNRLLRIGHNTPDNGMYDNAAMGFATLRRDGFAEITGEGELVTRRISFRKGDRLFVNADCSKGSLDVEIVGGAKRQLSGVDATKIEVLAAKPGTVQLKFRLRGGAKLYSFWFSDKTGRSGGYVAGGGPGYPGLRDY